MPGFDVTNEIHVPEIVRMEARAASRASSIREIPPGAGRLLVRRGAVVDLPDAMAEYDRLASIHAARVIDASRRTRTPHAISHASAALLHGLPLWALPALPEITAPVHTSSSSTGDVVRHTLPLPDEDVVELYDVPVTSLDRTIVDLARFVPPLEALVAADRAMSWSSDVDRYDRPGTERRAEQVRAAWIARVDALPLRARGSRAARSVIEWSTPWSESVRESWLRWVILTWGRRDVVAQCPIVTPEGTFFADLALPDGLLPDSSQRWACHEYDGDGKYHRDRARVLAEEARRERAIMSLGHGVLRFDRELGISAVQATARIAASLTAPLTAPLEPVLDLMPRRSQIARTRWTAEDPIRVRRAS